MTREFLEPAPTSASRTLLKSRRWKVRIYIHENVYTVAERLWPP